MKRLTKRRMYQKRRKKEKAEQRRRAQSMVSGKNVTTCKHNYSRKLNEHNPTNNNHQQNFSLSPIASYSHGLQLWWQTYCAAMEFHAKQQTCTLLAENRENQLMLLEKYANEYETSSEEDEDNYALGYDGSYNDADKNDEALKEYMDEGYVKFLEITHKHREELRLKRAESI